MKVIVALLFLYTVSLALGNSSVSSPRARFLEFTRLYSKVYDTQDEFEKRFSIFQQNLVTIEELNAQDPTAQYDVNKFSDLSPTEFLRYKGGVSNLNNLQAPKGVSFKATPPPPIPLIANPLSFDWTNRTPAVVTPIKNQGQCGSCWAFSTIGNIEGVWALSGKPLISLSESELVDCTNTSFGCNGGWPKWAMQDLLNFYKGQVDTEVSYPYVAANEQCTFSSGSVGAVITSYNSYSMIDQTTPVTETQLETLLVSLGPISICLNASPMQSYSSGISNPSSCPSDIDHCVTLVGYGVDATSGTKFWRIKNSWGPDWGEQGFYRLIKGNNQPDGQCGIQTCVTSAVV